MSALGLIGVLIGVAVSALFMWAVIRADERGERAYHDWYNHPDRVWNQWKHDAKE